MTVVQIAKATSYDPRHNLTVVLKEQIRKERSANNSQGKRHNDTEKHSQRLVRDRCAMFDSPVCGSAVKFC